MNPSILLALPCLSLPALPLPAPPALPAYLAAWPAAWLPTGLRERTPPQPARPSSLSPTDRDEDPSSTPTPTRLSPSSPRPNPKCEIRNPKSVLRNLSPARSLPSHPRRFARRSLAPAPSSSAGSFASYPRAAAAAAAAGGGGWVRRGRHAGRQVAAAIVSCPAACLFACPPRLPARPPASPASPPSPRGPSSTRLSLLSLPESEIRNLAAQPLARSLAPTHPRRFARSLARFSAVVERRFASRHILVPLSLLPMLPMLPLLLLLLLVGSDADGRRQAAAAIDPAIQDAYPACRASELRLLAC